LSGAGPATEGLAARSARGGALTGSAQAVRFVLTLGSTAVLARLLTPDDYGLIAMITAVTGFLTVNYLTRNADNVLIGWSWGSVPLGLHSRAYSLMMLPLSQINAPVAGVAPALSRRHDDVERVAAAVRGILATS
jgi:O-antigen/teichoic acid export membrane protein